MANLPTYSLGPVRVGAYHNGSADRILEEDILLGQDYVLRYVSEPQSANYYAREYAVTVDDLYVGYYPTGLAKTRAAAVKFLPLPIGSIPSESNDEAFVLPLGTDGYLMKSAYVPFIRSVAHGRIGYLLCSDLSEYDLPQAAESTDVNSPLGLPPLL